MTAPDFPDAAHLRASIKAAGWTCVALARHAGFDRTTVFYWLRKLGPLKGHTPNVLRKAFLSAGVDIGPDLQSAISPRGHVDPFAWIDAVIQPKLESERARLAMKAIRCGAIRTNGKPCPARPVAGKKRCRFHGGMSTGPRTTEGRQRIAEAQRKRWAKAKGR
jgi:hypothetical protein